MKITRRTLLQSGASICAAPWAYLPTRGSATPPPDTRARSGAGALRTLSREQARTLEALGEVLLPGSAREGLAAYIDRQLAVPLRESMLMIRYLGVRPPFAEFYRTGLAAVDGAAKGQFGAGFDGITAARARALVSQMADGNVAGWSGPPAGLFYFVLRSDAVDVVYGTQSGFAKLAVPYMPHIVPPTPWGE
jgi:hypothetical protein